jgi:thioredoxin reductase
VHTNGPEGTTTEFVDVGIVGGGAAGLSAALRLGRARRSVVLVDAGLPRNRLAPHMHGLLSRDGMPPLDLLQRGREEASVYGVRFVDGEVQVIEPVDGGFLLRGAGNILARRVVVATGLIDRLLCGERERLVALTAMAGKCATWRSVS